MVEKKIVLMVYSQVDIGLLGLSRQRLTQTVKGVSSEEDIAAFIKLVKV